LQWCCGFSLMDGQIMEKAGEIVKAAMVAPGYTTKV
jgi:hypothetical protein